METHSIGSMITRRQIHTIYQRVWYIHQVRWNWTGSNTRQTGYKKVQNGTNGTKWACWYRWFPKGNHFWWAENLMKLGCLQIFTGHYKYALFWILKAKGRVQLCAKCKQRSVTSESVTGERFQKNLLSM